MNDKFRYRRQFTLIGDVGSKEGEFHSIITIRRESPPDGIETSDSGTFYIGDKCRPDFSDIAFFDNKGNQLRHTGHQDGNVLWVDIPAKISEGENFFWMYYDSSNVKLFHAITYPPKLEESDYMKITSEGWHALHRMMWDWLAWTEYLIFRSDPLRPYFKFPYKLSWPGWNHWCMKHGNTCFACMYGHTLLCRHQGIDAISGKIYDVAGYELNHYCDFCPITWNDTGNKPDKFRFSCEYVRGSVFAHYCELYNAYDDDPPNCEQATKELRETCLKIRDIP